MRRKNRIITIQKQTILVTGGAGFIGSHLCERLLKKNYRVICLDNFNNFLYSPKLKKDNISKIKSHPKFNLIKRDILDEKLLKKIFSKEKIDKVIHLAALAGVRPSLLFPAKYIEVNIKGTINLLDRAREAKVKQFIYASSSSVYGKSSKIPFNESEKNLIPVSPYGASKLAGEIFCQTYHQLYNIPITILRFFTVYGPRQRPEMAIHKFVRLMKQKKSIPIYGEGNSSRDYTYIDDIVEGVIKSMRRVIEIEIFNLGNSKPIKLEELVEGIGKYLGVLPKVKKLPFQPGDVPMTFADIKKAKRILDWTPKTPLDKGIEKFIEWYKEKEGLLNKKS